jgi:hypothetical protein
MSTELQYIQDAYTNKEYKLADHLVKTNKVLNKKAVKFDSTIYLEHLFKKAVKYAIIQAKASKKSSKTPSFDKNSRIFLGIDIVSYGASNAKMAYVCKNKLNTETTIDIVHNHIGNLKLLPDYNEKDIEFIEQFQLIIKSAFQCFGKRWYELSEYDVANYKSQLFSLVEINQYPYIYFDDERYYRIETIVCMFFNSMIHCLDLDISKNERCIKKVCVSIPSDFHTYQRFVLKNCLDHIGLKNYIITIKSTALAMPFLAKDRTDSSRKLIIDFGSGRLYIF